LVFGRNKLKQVRKKSPLQRAQRGEGGLNNSRSEKHNWQQWVDSKNKLKKP
jgi:hypothetical protein